MQQHSLKNKPMLIDRVVSCLLFIVIICCNSAYAVTNAFDLNVDQVFYVPKRFNNTGGFYVSENGSIVGDLLEGKFLKIGKDKSNNLSPTNFITRGVIGGVPTIVVYEGSSFTNLHPISAVTSGFFVERQATANFHEPVNGNGCLTNNGTINILANGDIGNNFIFINKGALNVAGNFTVPQRTTNIGSLYMVGEATINGDLHNATLEVGKNSSGDTIATNAILNAKVDKITSINLNANASLSITNELKTTLSKPVNGTGVLYNYGDLTLTTGAQIADSVSFENYNKLNFASDFVLPDNFVNTGSIWIFGAGNPIGAINGGTSLNVGRNSDGVAIDTNLKSNFHIKGVESINVYKGVFIVQNVDVNCGALNNYATMSIKNNFTSELITNHDGAILSLDAANLNSALKNKSGAVFIVDRDSINSKNVENYGEMVVNDQFAMADFTNAGVANLRADILANNLDNTGTIASSAGVRVANLYNAGLISLAGRLTANDINNVGRMQLGNEVLAHEIQNSGHLYVKGLVKANVAKFNSPGIIDLSIHKHDIYDALQVHAPINIANGQVNVNSCFLGEANQKYEWRLLVGPSIETNAATKISIPHSSLHFTWDSSIDRGVFKVTYYREPFTNLISKGLPMDIAVALEQIAVESKTDEHVNFIHTIAGCSCQEEHATNIIKLKPNANSNAHFVAIHNATFKKIETRISALQDPSAVRGIAVGDVTGSKASWGAAFGSVANQKAISGNLGYRATAIGAIVGIDKQVPNDDIYGAAMAFSNSNITEAASINSKTRITGYHLLGYGTNFFYGDNFFEWLFTGIINQNKGEREVIVNGTNLNVGSSYHNYQVGGRINLGKNMDFHTWGLAQVNTLQYSFLHQPSYNENGSPAALHISRFDNNIVTLGSGLRVFCRPNFRSGLVAKPAVHAMLTYDAVSSSQGVTANFILGGSDFTIYQNPSRIAVRLGADMGCEIKEHIQLQFSYDLELRSRYSDNSAEIKIKYLF